MYVKMFLLIFLFAVGCQDTSNYYYDSNEELDMSDTEWGQDPLICGTEISENSFLFWEFSRIEDEQQVLCSPGEDACRYYLNYATCMLEGIFFHSDGSFSFHRGAYDEGDDVCTDSTDATGTWKTMNGMMELSLSSPESNTEKANYFFHEKTYSYSTAVGSGSLSLFNSQTAMELEEQEYY